MLETRRRRCNYHTGKDHCHWKGGKTTNNGWILVRVKNHPKKNQSGYVAEHRIVVEKKIGRYLSGNEKVHHINLDKKDNRIENLYVCHGHAHHRKIHESLERASEKALKKGLIKFDPNTGEYYV